MIGQTDKIKEYAMKSEIFYKTMSKFYDLVDVIYFRNYSNSPRKVVFKTIENGDSVLDLCTGTATNALKIAKSNSQSKVIGIDLSKDMLGIARKKAHKADILNIKLYRMDATKLKFKDKCFDKILFLPIEVLEPKPYKAFISKDLKTYFEKYGLKVKSEKHCDYSKVLILKK